MADLLLQRNGERIFLDRRLVGPSRRRAIVQADPLSQRRGRRPRDPDGLGRDPVRFGRAHDARAGEAPAPVDDDADPEAFAFAGGDALDSTALDRDRFLEAMDDPNVGIRCAELHRRIQGALAQVTHREAEGSRADGRQRARAFSLFPMARLFRHAGLTRSARLPGATPKHPRTLDRRSRRRASISEASPS